MRSNVGSQLGGGIKRLTVEDAPVVVGMAIDAGARTSSRVADARLSAVNHWMEQSGFVMALGVECVEATAEVTRLRLPYHEANSNPGGALHGGCAASLGLIGGHLIAGAALGPESGPFVTISSHVAYLAAAIEEEVVGTTELTRKGKELCFADTSVVTFEGKPISRISTVVASGAGAPPAQRPAASDPVDGCDPGPMGPFVATLPFIASRQVSVEHMANGRSRLAMPLIEGNADGDSAFHEGAVLALLDTTGAMAAWAETGPGPYKASTAAIQAQMLGPPRAEQLVGHGGVIHRENEVFWADVAIADAGTSSLQARGTVVYRIVT